MSRASMLLAIFFFPAFQAGPVLAQPDDIRYSSGNIQVRRDVRRAHDGGEQEITSHSIMRDHVHFGQCFAEAKYRRLPTTYYHPQGPFGLAMKKFNWFPGPVNTYHADARFPASLTGLALSGHQAPLGQMVALWSEPPIAVIGLEAGTPAAYARPGQYFHFYEPNQEMITLHERQPNERFFHFIPEARARGAQVHIVHGSPRQQLSRQGPRGFYHLILLEACSGEDAEKIFLDLFTREGIAQCFEHLAEDGILCVHTSHRFLDLPKVLAAIGNDLGLAYRRGHDQAPGVDWGVDKVDLGELSHFTSEWVLLARHQRCLDAVCTTPPNYQELLKKKYQGIQINFEYWSIPAPNPKVWTDQGPNLLHGVLRGHPFAMRYNNVAGPWIYEISKSLRNIGAGLETQRWISSWSSLPKGVEDWMVQTQLRDYPEVAKLWSPPGGRKYNPSALSPTLVAPDVKVGTAATVCFLEGPAVDGRGNVFFSDVAGNRLLKMDAKGLVSTFREPSGRANGNTFDTQGNLITCEGAESGPGGGRRIVRTNMKTGELSVLTERFVGKRYNSPNDLIADARGRIWFTDPRYGADRSDLEMDIEGVYRIDPDGKVARVLTQQEVQRPNGIAVAPDQKTLYVIDSHPKPGGNRKIWSFAISDQGELFQQKLIYDFGMGRGGDGMRLDTKGNLWVAAGISVPRGPGETLDNPPGIYVISPQGQLLGRIPVPENIITNLAFGGPERKTLFITAGKTLYQIPVQVSGYALYPSLR